jgi:hypothetical protein
VVGKGWFDDERTETIKNKNEAYNKMRNRHKTRGAAE